MLKPISIALSTMMLVACGGGSSNNNTGGGTGGSGSGGGTNPPPDAYAALRTTAQSQLASSNAPAVSIAIMKDGQVVFAEAFGNKTHNGSEAVDADTLFQLGSTTKMFTGLAALQLVDNNTLTLDQSLPNALPGINLADGQSGWHDINLHHLLTHQSGLEDFIDWAENNELMPYALDGFTGDSGQMNPAGKFWNYSNPGWSYLGAIVEHHEGRPYNDVMKDKVFGPLGMTRATSSFDDVKADGNYALGVGKTVIDGQIVDLQAESLEQIDQNLFSIPAGSYTWASASELVKMGHFLMNGNNDILSDALRIEITDPQVGLLYGLDSGYGYGVFNHKGMQFNSDWYQTPVWEHGGNTLAYTNMFYMLPEYNVTIAIMSSGQSTDFSGTLYEAIKSVIDLPTAQSVPRAPVAIELLDNHVGEYVLEDVGSVFITREEDSLKMVVPALDAGGVSYQQNLTAFSGSVFTAEVDGESLDLTFIAEVDGGDSTYIRNRGFVAIRKDAIGPGQKAPKGNLLKRSALSLN